MEQKKKHKIYWKAIFEITEKEKEIIDATEELFKSMEEDFEALHAYSVLSAIRETKKNNQEEITILREQLRGTREELAEARKQREEAMEKHEIAKRVSNIQLKIIESKDLVIESLNAENTWVKQLVKAAWDASEDHLTISGSKNKEEWLKSKGI